MTDLEQLKTPGGCKEFLKGLPEDCRANILEVLKAEMSEGESAKVKKLEEDIRELQILLGEEMGKSLEKDVLGKKLLAENSKLVENYNKLVQDYNKLVKKDMPGTLHVHSGSLVGGAMIEIIK